MKPLRFFVCVLIIQLLSAMSAIGQSSTRPSIASPKDSSVQNRYKMIMTVRNAPGFTVQLSGQYDYGVFELSGNNNGDFDSEELKNGENFGVRHGIGSTLTFKIPLHEKGNIRLNISAMYNIFNSTFSKVLVSGKQNQYAKYNIISGIIGIENNFTPGYKIKTYVGAGIVASLISGKLGLYSDSLNFSESSVVPAFRLGVRVSSGLEYMLSNSLGVNFGITFTHANLWLKDSKQSEKPGEVYLNDKRVTPKIPFSGFKQFAWGSFSAGINWYFGINEKKYIYKSR